MTNQTYSPMHSHPETSAARPGEPADRNAPPEFTAYLKEYARERPEVVALWCFGIGFILGWKLKPW